MTQINYVRYRTLSSQPRSLPCCRSFISSSNRHRIGRHRKAGGEFRDCAHIFRLWRIDRLHARSFAPRNVSELRPAQLASCELRARPHALARRPPIRIILPPPSGQSPVKCPLPDIELAPTSKRAQRVDMSASLEEGCDGQIRQPIKYQTISTRS